MSNNEILLDTNVIRRLLEDNSSMIKVMLNMQTSGYKFSISDMSLFELLDSKDVQSNPNKFLSILFDYKIVPIYKEIIKDFNQDFFNWFKKPISILEMKRQLFPSFSFTLSTFLADFTNAIIIFLANVYCKNYSFEFYQYIVYIINNGEAQKHFEQLLESCYIYNNEKIRKRLPDEFKDLILRVITYYNLLQIKSTFNEQDFNVEFKIQQTKYQKYSFKQICSSLLSEKDIVLKFDDKISNIDKDFITYYFKQSLSKNGSFSINDITDYINFKYAMNYCYSYYTTDTTSLKKYSTYFNDPSIKEFLAKINYTLNQYEFISHTKNNF